MADNVEEIATLQVAGINFQDWETVWVQRRYAESCPQFRFTAAERDDPEYFTLLRFTPGDDCTVTLAGQMAVTGIILIRQVAYDANNHQVMLQGKGVTWWAATSSVIHKTGNFDKKSFEQAAKEVIAPHPVGVKVIGSLDPTPFEKLQLQQGETVWDFCERIARPRGVIMGSDHLGNFLFIGPHAGELVHHLVEGVNILRLQCVISQEEVYDPYIVNGQAAGNDESHGREKTQMRGETGGSSRLPRPRLTPAEQPVSGQPEVQERSRNEAKWGEGTKIQCSITVQGWINPGTGKLWEPGEDVHVESPMALLDMNLKLEVVTFTQDRNSGSLTTLDLREPWGLNDTANLNPGSPGPGPGKNTSNSLPATPAAHNLDQPAAEIKEKEE
jgi:prophage tail gpP-like protein